MRQQKYRGSADVEEETESIDEVTEAADIFHGAYRETSLKMDAVPAEPSSIAILNTPAGRMLSGKHAYQRRSAQHGVHDQRMLAPEDEKPEQQKSSLDEFVEYNRPPTQWSALDKKPAKNATTTGDELFLDVHRELGIDDIGTSRRADDMEDTRSRKSDRGRRQPGERVSFARRISQRSEQEKPLLLEGPSTPTALEPPPMADAAKDDAQPGEITKGNTSSEIRITLQPPQEEIEVDAHVRRERVVLLQKVTRSMGKTGTTIYNSVSRDQLAKKRSKKGFRKRMRDVWNSKVIRNTRNLLQNMERSVSRTLFLNIDLMKTLGRPDSTRYSARTLTLFPLNPPLSGDKNRDYYAALLRRFCIFLVEWPVWNHLILLFILANGAVLAMFDPLEDGSNVRESGRRNQLEGAIRVFSVVFLLEMLVSLIARGAYFAGRNSYLRSHWSKADFVLVALGVLDFVPGLSSRALSALRAFRVLRPLRAITRFSHLRVLVILFLAVMPTLATVVALLCVIFVFFAMVSIQLWQGVLRRRCFHVDSGQRYLADLVGRQSLDRVCTLQNSIVEGAFRCPESYDCLPQVNEVPWRGFDNFLSAVMTWVQVATLDRWSSVMDPIIDGYSPFAVLVFVVFIIVTPITTLKLFLAVIANKLQDLQEETRRRKIQDSFASWMQRSLSILFQRWYEHALVLRLRRGAGLVKLSVLRIRGPTTKAFQAWRDFTFGADASEASKVAFIRRRKARRLRRELAEDAMSLDMKLALLMASHPRLGRKSRFAGNVQGDMRFWQLLVGVSAEVLRQELREELFDSDWESGLYDDEQSIRCSRKWLRSNVGRALSVLHPSHIVDVISRSATFEGIIGIASLVNVLLLMAEHSRPSTIGRTWSSDDAYNSFHRGIEAGYIAVSAVLIFEFVVKVSAFGLQKYLSSRWNLLDFVIVLLCMIDLPQSVDTFQCLADGTTDTCSGDGAFWNLSRSLRLLRFFKVVNIFPELARQIAMTISTFKPVLGLLALGALFSLVFISMGISFFGGKLQQPITSRSLALGANVFIKLPGVNRGGPGEPGIIRDLDNGRMHDPYHVQVRTGFTNEAADYFLPPDDPRRWAGTVATSDPVDPYIELVVPRANYNTFFFAMTSVFQILLNKGWSVLLWSSVSDVGPEFCLYYFALIFLGSWLLMNMAVAIVITGLGPTMRGDPQARQRSQRSSGERLVDALIWVVGRVASCFCGVGPEAFKRRASTAPAGSDGGRDQMRDADDRDQSTASLSRRARALREASAVVYGHAWYHKLRLVVILLSLGSLMMESRYVDGGRRALVVAVYTMTNLFFVGDTVLLLFAVPLQVALSNVRHLTDAVALSLAMVDEAAALTADPPALATGGSVLGTLRLIRIATVYYHLLPQGQQDARSSSVGVLLQSITNAIKPLMSTAVLSVVFFSALAILGMQLLGGRLHFCTDPLVFYRSDCVGAERDGTPRQWIPNALGFDWFGSAVESVWVIATSNDWPDLMWAGIDATGKASGAKHNNNLGMSLFFFITAGYSNLVVLNIFLAVFSSVYRSQNEKAIDADSRPERPRRRQLPEVFDLRDIQQPRRITVARMLERHEIELVINLSIVAALITMMADSHGAGEAQLQLAATSNAFFTMVFGVEVMAQVYAYGGLRYYVLSTWHCFDFLCYVSGLISVITDSKLLNISFAVNTQVLRVFRTIRVFRALRALRLIRSMRRLKAVVVALVQAFPMVAHMLTLLSFAFFVYAVVGVAMFSHMCVQGDQLLPDSRAVRCLLVSEGDSLRNLDTKLLDPHTQFKHFGWAILALLKISTVDGMSPLLHRMDSVPGARELDALDKVELEIGRWRNASSEFNRQVHLRRARALLPGCVTASELDVLQERGAVDCRFDGQTEVGACQTTCGSGWFAQFYFITFATLSSFLLLNVMVSVLLEQMRLHRFRGRPRYVSKRLTDDSLRLLVKRWKWNSILRVAYGHWLILNDYSLHTDSARVTSSAASSEWSDFSSASSFDDAHSRSRSASSLGSTDELEHLRLHTAELRNQRRNQDAGQLRDKHNAVGARASRQTLRELRAAVPSAIAARRTDAPAQRSKRPASLQPSRPRTAPEVIAVARPDSTLPDDAAHVRPRTPLVVDDDAAVAMPTDDKAEPRSRAGAEAPLPQPAVVAAAVDHTRGADAVHGEPRNPAIPQASSADATPPQSAVRDRGMLQSTSPPQHTASARRARGDAEQPTSSVATRESNSVSTRASSARAPRGGRQHHDRGSSSAVSVRKDSDASTRASESVREDSKTRNLKRSVPASQERAAPRSLDSIDATDMAIDGQLGLRKPPAAGKTFLVLKKVSSGALSVSRQTPHAPSDSSGALRGVDSPQPPFDPDSLPPPQAQARLSPSQTSTRRRSTRASKRHQASAVASSAAPQDSHEPRTPALRASLE